MAFVPSLPTSVEQPLLTVTACPVLHANDTGNAPLLTTITTPLSAAPTSDVIPQVPASEPPLAVTTVARD